MLSGKQAEANMAAREATSGLRAHHTCKTVRSRRASGGHRPSLSNALNHLALQWAKPSLDQPHIVRHLFFISHFVGSVSRIRRALSTRRGFLRWTDIPNQ